MTNKLIIELTDWPKSNIKSLELIHSQADENLKYTLLVSEKIASRAFVILSILLPLITFLLAYLFEQKINANTNINLNAIFYLKIIALVISTILVFLVLIIFPRKSMHSGRPPIESFKNQFVQDDSMKDNEPYIALLIGEIEVLQEKITINNSKNHFRILLLKTLIIILILSIFISILILFI